MNARSRTGARLRVTLCFLAMAAVAAPILWWLDMSLVTVILAAIAIGCLVAMFYAWWLGQRVLKPLDRVGRADARRRP